MFPTWLAVIRTQDDHRQPNTGFSVLSSAGDGRLVKEGPLDSLPFNISSRNASTPSAAREAASDQAPAAAAAVDLQSSEQTFHWPGLEAVIESYHHYIEGIGNKIIWPINRPGYLENPGVT